ncbi:UDP-N-acetylmuramoylalanine--D-glutamate ligase [Anaerolinea thermolimosa]|nr:UDP-N-acetylmuramoylalanine--D-glutamate ligase [Anaerolinea thermolimosa]
MARFLATHHAHVILNDQRPAEALEKERQLLSPWPIRWVTGGHPLELLDEVDWVCISGGVPLTLPLVVEAKKRGLPLTNDSQIFMEEVPCPVIGITGSAGKTTTTTLVGRMAQAALQPPRRAWVGGNIGTPLIDRVTEIQPHDLVVLELSSFQLELMTRSPQVAAVLNITPNHLDRHQTMEAYTAAKANILHFQSKEDVAILNREDAGAWGLHTHIKGRLITFGIRPPSAGMAGTFIREDTFYATDGYRERPLFPVTVNQLRGEHNLLNALAACAIGLAAEFPDGALRAGIEGFRGVAHRLELVREWKGVRWYNDSIATAPERTLAALRSFHEPVVLMLGGRDKALPWDDLARMIHERVDHVIVFGEAAEKIRRAIGPLKEGTRPYSLQVCSGVEDAVRAAAQVASPGSVVLFSPGGTSFDEFKDFEERGERFRQWVKALS